VAAAGHALIASKGKVDGEGGAETKARLSLELLAFVPALALLVGEVANSPVRRLLPQELLTGMGVRQARSLHARFIGDGTSTRAGGEAEGAQVPWSSTGSSGGQIFPARWVVGQVLRALGGGGPALRAALEAAVSSGVEHARGVEEAAAGQFGLITQPPASLRPQLVLCSTRFS
jgi:hypothetical protein